MYNTERGRKRGLGGFFDAFNQTYEGVRKVARDWKTDDVMNEKPVEYDGQYTPEQVKQIEAASAAGAENPYEGVAPSKRYMFAGKDSDKPFTDIQLDGLRAGKLASIASEFGDHAQAMALRRDARLAEKENSELELQRRIGEINDRYAEARKKGVQGGVEFFNSNQGLFGVGKNGGAKMGVPAQMPDGNLLVTLYDDKGKVLKEQPYSPDDLTKLVDAQLMRSHLAELAAVAPEKYMEKAMQYGISEKQLEELSKQHEWQRKHQSEVLEETKSFHKGTLDNQRAEIGMRSRELGLRALERSDARVRQGLEDRRHASDAVDKLLSESSINFDQTDKGPVKNDQRAAELREFVRDATNVVNINGKQIPLTDAMRIAPDVAKSAVNDAVVQFAIQKEVERQTGQKQKAIHSVKLDDQKSSDYGLGVNKGLGMGQAVWNNTLGQLTDKGKVIRIDNGTKGGLVLDYSAAIEGPYGKLIALAVGDQPKPNTTDALTSALEARTTPSLRDSLSRLNVPRSQPTFEWLSDATARKNQMSH